MKKTSHYTTQQYDYKKFCKGCNVKIQIPKVFLCDLHKFYSP